MFGIFFAYFGYPLSLWVLTPFKRKQVQRNSIQPLVTIIVAAYNEEKRIRRKIENLLDTDYPKEKLEIVIVSDGSTDLTGKIVAEYEPSVKHISLSEHSGKEYAQSRGVEIAKGEILIFTDAAACFQPDGISKIVSNFADPTVGCVSSRDSLICRDGNSSGEGLYIRYEMWLRHLESQVFSMVGLSGSFFAARMALCRNFNSEIDSDFQTVLNAIEAGMRAVMDNGTACNYYDLSDPAKEMTRKERTVLRGITGFFNNLHFLNVARYGIFAYGYFSHKLLRWLVPFFVLFGFLCNLILALNSIVFFVLMGLQALFIVMGILHYSYSKNLKSSIFKIPGYFILTNYCIAIAWVRFLQGKRVVKWTPSER
jgi:cellulose synthase/poly-beta-1,6-N-acetylglucosamine synthase-like glycosyltransferase